ncbi:MAG: hypothetical protein IKV41_02620 [Oscillospiraceae bacterium]|nr:hypothetical protein [Oscillospiraceae bacterium]
MSKTVVNITAPFQKPREISQLVIFNDNEPFISADMAGKYLNICRRYALHYGVYLVPSRIVVDNNLHLCLFDPKGNIVGIQSACRINLSFREKFERGTDINIIETPMGKVFLCVDVDIYDPAIIRRAVMMGAQIIISSQYIDSYQFHKGMIDSGIWNAAQTNKVLIIGCCNHFKAIAAPMDLTQDGSGYILHPTNDFSALGKLFLNKLDRDSNIPNVMQNKDFVLNFSREMLRE